MSISHPAIAFNALRRLYVVRPRTELKELYIFSLLFSFASALITIFEPVFFYQQGFSLASIALYYAIHYTIFALILPLGGKFAARFGLERSLAVSMPIFIVYFLTLASIPAVPNLFWVALGLLALHKIFYWPAYHADLAKFGDRNNRGTELSWLNVVTWGSGILGPLIGGLVATFFGFPVLFLLAAGTALLAGVPLLRTKEEYRVQRFAYSAPWRLLVSRQHRRLAWSMVGMIENLIDLVFWPIFAFIVLGAADKLGFITSLTVLLMTVLGFFIGEISDRWPRRTVLRLHLPFMVLGYIFRPLAATPLRIFLTDALARSAYIGVRLPLIAQLYTRGKAAGALRYGVALEVALAVSKAAAAYVLAIVFASTLPFTGFVVAFTMAAAFSLFYLAL